MNVILNLFFVLTFLVLCKIQLFALGNVIDYIDQHLPLTKWTGDDVTPKLAAAKKLLEKKLASPNSGVDVIQALRTFISLEQIGQPNLKCNNMSIAILKANYKLVGGVSSIQVERHDVFGMKKAIYDAIKNHAIECSKIYASNFDETVKNQLDQMDLKKLKIITNPMIMRRVNDWKYAYGDNTDAKLAYQSMVTLAREQRDRNRKYFAKVWSTPEKEEFFTDKFSALVEEYLFQPCNKYVQALSSLMQSVKFDSSIVDPKLGSREEQYNICDQLIQVKSQFTEKLQQIGVKE